MRSQLEKRSTLRTITRADYNHLVSLEREIFPNTSGIFDSACIRHAMQYYNFSILIGKHAGKIESYFSFFPLTKNGFQYCVKTGTTTICQFPVHLFKPRRSQIQSIFLEVLATTRSCPYSIKFDTIAIASSLIKEFSYLPFLSCPVSDDGLKILNKLKFEPLKMPGLNKLYLRVPANGGAS